MGNGQVYSKVYYSIGEVAKMLSVNESLLRFWEKQFPGMAPQKNDKGTRYFRPSDIENFKLIYHLVKERGMTLEGARKKMKQNKEMVVQNHQIVERLRFVREELLKIREELSHLSKGENEL